MTAAPMAVTGAPTPGSTRGPTRKTDFSGPLAGLRIKWFTDHQEGHSAPTGSPSTPYRCRPMPDPDFRALCAELFQTLEHLDREYDVPIPPDLLERARTDLSQPVTEPWCIGCDSDSGIVHLDVTEQTP
jgi:hypothetical protein